MEYEKYIIKFFYDGDRPKCACGCKKETKFFKGLFLKYFEDHKNKIKVPEDIKLKIRNTKLRNSSKEYKKLGLDQDELKNLWELYKNTNKSINEISQLAGVDGRTIKKYWVLLNITNKKMLNRVSKKHKYNISIKKRKTNRIKKIDRKLYLEILDYVYNKKSVGYPITFRKCMNEFDINLSVYIFKNNLVSLFGKKVLNLFKNSCSSQEELNFLLILKFYFGDKNVFGSYPLEGRIYDFMISDKLLIEYDGNFWHSNINPYTKIDIIKKRDSDKNQIAIKNGFKIYRFGSKDLYNINTVKKIKDMLEEGGK